MPLDFQTIQTNFRFGTDEGTDPKAVPFGVLTTCKNLVWKKSARLEQRRGITALSTAIVGGGNVSAASRLILRDDELALTDGSLLYSHTSSGWVSRGKLPEAGLEWETAHDTVDGIKCFDSARLTSGTTVEIWSSGDPTLPLGDPSSIYYRVVDVNGATLEGPLRIDQTAAYSVRAITDGTSWCVLWISANTLWCQTTGGVTVPLAIGVMESDFNHARFDACTSAAGFFTVAYALAAGGIGLLLCQFGATPSVSLIGSVTGVTTTDIEAIAVSSIIGETLYVAYWDIGTTNQLLMATADPSTFVQLNSAFVVESQFSQNPKLANVGLARRTSADCVVAYSFCTTGNKDEPPGVMKTKLVSSSAGITDGHVNYYVRLLSRPFFIGAVAYAVVGNWSLADTFSPTGQDPDGITGSDTFLVDVTVNTDPPSVPVPSRLVGKIEWIVGGVWGPGYVSNASVYTDIAFVPTPYVSSEASNAQAWRQGVKRVTVSVRQNVPGDMWRSVTIGQEAYLVAGVLTGYDGVEAVGAGWAHPAFIDPSNTIRHQGAGGSIGAGAYLYNVAAERRSAAGILHRAPLGTTLRRAFGPGDDGDLDIALIPHSLSIAPSARGLLAIYRTLKSGSVLQRLTVEPTYSTVFNGNGFGPSIVFNDKSADTDIGNSLPLAERPAHYTETGELEDVQPPAVVTQCLYRNRIWAVLGDRQTLVFSKSAVQNPGIAPGFSPAFRTIFNDVLTGLAVLDERLIIFSETGIYTLAGDGPTVTGDNSDFVSPNKLQTDTGCTNPRSICSGADGVYFDWNSQIYLLTRGLETVWIGKPVRDLLATYPVITSAVVVAKQNQVRFTANTTDGSAGIVLVYSYTEKQWSHFEYLGGIALVDAIMVDGVYTMVTAAGQVYQESETSTLDLGSTFVPTVMETAWVHNDGPLSYYSARNFMLDGIAASTHELHVSVGYNGETAYDAPRVWAEQIAGATLWPGPIAVRLSIGPRRKSRSIRFKIERTSPSMIVDSATANSWSAMALEYGVKKGPIRVPVAQTK